MDENNTITGLKDIAAAILKQLPQDLKDKAMQLNEKSEAVHPLEHLLVARYLSPNEAANNLKNYLSEDITVAATDISAIIDAVQAEVAIGAGEHPFHEDAGWIALVKTIAEKEKLKEDDIGIARYAKMKADILKDLSSDLPIFDADQQALLEYTNLELEPFYAARARGVIFDALGQGVEKYREIIASYRQQQDLDNLKHFSEKFVGALLAEATPYPTLEKLAEGIAEQFQQYQATYERTIKLTPPTADQLKDIFPASEGGYHLKNAAIMQAFFATANAEGHGDSHPFGKQAGFIACVKTLGENLVANNAPLNREELRDTLLKPIRDNIKDYPLFEGFTESELTQFDGVVAKVYEKVDFNSVGEMVKDAKREKEREQARATKKDVAVTPDESLKTESTDKAPPSNTNALIALFAGAITTIAGLLNLKKKQSTEPKKEGEEEPKQGFSTGAMIATAVGAVATGWAVYSLISNRKAVAVQK